MKRTGSKLKRSTTTKKSSFVYHKRDPEKLRKRASRQGARYDSPFKDAFDQYRPKPGDNAIRILPPTWEGADHFGYTLWVHKRVGADNGTYLCPLKMKGKKCPICEAAKEARDAGEADEAKALEAKESIVYWILDREGDDPALPLLYMISWTQDRDISALCEDKRSGKILLIDHPDEGYDLYFKRTGQGLKTRYTAHSIDRHATPVSDDDAEQLEVLKYIEENPLSSVLRLFDYSYLENALSGGSNDKDEEETEDEEEEEKPSRRKPKDEDEDEEETENSEEEDEEEEEDEKPTRSRRAAVKDEDEDEEEETEDEDEEEEEETKPKSRRRSKDEDDEEEEETEDEDEEEDEKPKRVARVERTSRRSRR